jgi:hypothetical protein
MKAVFISYGQSLNDAVMELLDKLKIRGFSRWDETYGRGSEKGEPHYGTHAWPTKNCTIISIMEDEKATLLLQKLRLLNEQAEALGMSAFVWNVEEKL